MACPFVVFDFDGTVADSFDASLAAYNRIAPRLHLRAVHSSEIANLRRMGAGQLMQELGISMWKLPRLMIAVRSDLHDHFASVKPIAKMSEALHKLRASGCQLAMVTSNSGENVEQFLRRHGMDDFQTVVSGASIFGKATRLRRLMKTARADPKTTVYIGDTAPDLQAAREAGTLAVGVTWGFSDKAPLAAEGPDALVEAPEELSVAVLALLSRQ